MIENQAESIKLFPFDQLSVIQCVLNKNKIMFSLFKKRSEKDMLNKRYLRLMEEAQLLSKRDRTAGDKKYAEAQEVLDKIDELEKQA
jgi:hypothetical protein